MRHSLTRHALCLADGDDGAGAAHQVGDHGKQAAKPAPTADSSSFKTPAPPKAATRLGGVDGMAGLAAGARVAAAAAGGSSMESPSLTVTVLEPVSSGALSAAAVCNALMLCAMP